MGHHVPRDDVVGGDVELLREEPGERAVLGSAESPHRHHVLLAVEDDSLLVHVAVEVDRELGQPEDGSIDLDEPDFARPQRDATREAEVAVEPRVDQRAAVHVDAELPVPGAAGVGARLHAQVRAVGVRADDDEPRSGVGGHVPRDDRAAADHERAAGRTVDGLTERLPAEARFGERRGCGLGRVIGRRRSPEELEEIDHP